MKHLWYTDGPASSSLVAPLLQAGATGVRLTMSHGIAKDHVLRAREIRSLASHCGRECTIVADLAGEKFRLGDFGGSTHIEGRMGQLVKFVLGPVLPVQACNMTEVPVRDRSLFSLLTHDSHVIIGDGSANLKVVHVEEASAVLEFLSDGTIHQNRGLTVLGSAFRPKCLTDKDVADLDVILEADVFDAVALSFVRNASDVEAVKAMAHNAGKRITVIAKIETPEAIENVQSIAGVADFLMAARGDLALTMPWVELPAAVMAVAKAAAARSVPWMLATQVAEGLHRFSMLTRAEICDLARWMEEGCSGVLLAFETAFGPRPVEAIAATSRLMERWYSRG